MNTVKSTQPAILVDWNDLKDFPAFTEWVINAQNKITVVLLVSDPKLSDFDVDSLKTDKLFEPDVVLRNSAKKPMPNIAFKTAALLAVQDMSNLKVVAAFDGDQDTVDMYNEGGVPITAKTEWWMR